MRYVLVFLVLAMFGCSPKTHPNTSVEYLTSVSVSELEDSMYCGTVGPSVMCLVIKDHDGVRSEYRVTLSGCSEKGVVMGNGGNRPLIFIPESHACLSKGHAYRLFVANGENSLHLYRPETRLHLILEKLN